MGKSQEGKRYIFADKPAVSLEYLRWHAFIAQGILHFSSSYANLPQEKQNFCPEQKHSQSVLQSALQSVPLCYTFSCFLL